MAVQRPLSGISSGLQWCGWLGVGALLMANAGCRKHSGFTDGLANEKTVVAKLMVRPGNDKAFDWKRNLEDFYDNQAQVLDDAELKAVARANAAKVVPPPDAPATVQVVRIRGSEMLSLITHCPSVDYGKAFLNALIDAYVVKVQGSRLDQPVALPSTAPPEMTEVEKKYRDAESAEKIFAGENDLALVKTAIDNSQRHLARLRSAENFYVGELDLIKRTGLDMDITRRKYPPQPPADMPAELARVVQLGLTPNQLAYLNAMTKADSAAKEATRPAAQKDETTQVESLQRQLATVKDLQEDERKRIDTQQAILTKSKELESSLEKTHAEFEKEQSSESAQKNQAVASPKAGSVVVSVVQKPEVVNASP